MLKKLNQEIVVKRTLLQRIIDSIISAVALTILLYFCLTDFNQEIVEFLKSVAENNIATEATLILFPILLIITITMNIGMIVTTSNPSASKTNKKNKK